jgi:HAD superfamily hydrolase (TIGR01509 family)
MDAGGPPTYLARLVPSQDLFAGVEVACFDLFDTLIRIDTARLPVVRWGGGEIRTTLPIVHERIFAERGVPLDRLVDAVRSMWMEVRKELNREGGSEDERYAEVAAVEKYRRMLREMRSVEEHEVDAVARQVADTHHATLVSAAFPVEGAREVLERVRARGCRTALVSNWDHADAGPAMLAQTGLAELLDHVAISEAVGVRKPHRRIFEDALAAFDAAPERALHVGDLARPDAWGAGRLGMKTVWINAAGKPYPEDEHRPTLVVSRLAELLDHL